MARKFLTDLSLSPSQKIDFGSSVGDKLLLWGNTFGLGIEDSTLTNWSATQFRWRVGGSSVSAGTEKMLLDGSWLQINPAGTGGVFDSALRVGSELSFDSQWSTYGRIGVGVSAVAGIMKFRTGAGNVVSALSIEGGQFNFQTATSTGSGNLATMATKAYVLPDGRAVFSYTNYSDASPNLMVGDGAYGLSGFANGLYAFGGEYVDNGAGQGGYSGGGFALKGNQSGRVYFKAGSDGAYFTNYKPATVPLYVKGASSQSAALQQWQNSSGTVLSSVNQYGALSLNDSYSNIYPLFIHGATVNDQGFFDTSAGYDLTQGGSWYRALGTRVYGDSAYRFILSNSGKMEWGPGGATAIDTNLYRAGVSALKTDGDVYAVGNQIASHGLSYQVNVGWTPGGLPGIQFGSAQDTNLYRSAADTLKTDDNFIAATLSVPHSGYTGYSFKTELNTVDIGLNNEAGGWARSIRIVRNSGSNGQDGGAFGVYGSAGTPYYVFMSIPTSSHVGYDSTKMIALTNAGNVGIGNANPASKLEVVGSSEPSAEFGSFMLRSGAVSTKKMFFGFSDTYGAGHIGVVNSGLSWLPLLLNPIAGTVGIHTTAPWTSAYLDVAGNINADGNLYFRRGSIGTPYEVGILWEGSNYGLYRSAEAWDNPNYAQLTMKWITGIVIDGGSAYGKSGTVIQPGSGNVAIGTTNLTTGRLHVQTAAGADAIGGNLVLSRYFNAYNDSRASALFQYNTAGVDYLMIGVSGDGGSNNSPNQYSQAKMIIGANGRVGIGTLGPLAKLDVLHGITTNVVNNLAQFGYGGDLTNRSINIQQIGSPSTTNQFVLLNGSLGSGSVTGTPTFTSAYARSWGLESTDSSLSIITAAAGTNQAAVRPLTVSFGASLGISISVPLDMGSQKITGLATPVLSTDAANKGYVDRLPPTVNDGGNPDQVTGVTLYPAVHTMGVKWTQVTNTDMGIGSGQYRIQVDVNAGDFSSPVREVVTTGGFGSVSGLGAGLAYKVRVRAEDPFGGIGAWSATVNATTAEIVSGDIAAGTITAADIAADTITAGNIAAGAITSSELNTGAVIAGKIAARAIVAADIAADTITSGEIAANAITATEIAAGAITAEKLTVASYKDSAIINGSFEEASSADATMASGWTYGGWSGTGARGVNGDAVLSTTSPLSGTQSMKLTGGLPSIITVMPIPVVAGDKWYVSVTGKNPANSTSAGIYIRFVDQNGADMYDLGIENAAVGTGKTVFEGTATIPSGVTSVRLFILWYGPFAGGNTTGFYVDDVVIRKATGAVQIIDGAITAAKVAAGAITASKLETTLALVGNIQSSASAPWVSQTSGFKIDGATGNAEFNGTLFIKANTTLKGDLTVGSSGAGLIKSDGYSALSAGYKLENDGSAEFNNLLARGDIKALSISFPESTAILSPSSAAGGFETGVGAWSGLTQSNTVAKTGTYSGRFTTPYGESWTTAYLDISNPNPTRDQWYRVEAWVYTAATCRVVFGIAPGTANDRSVDFVPAVTTWTKVQAHRMIPAGQNMRVSLAGSTGGASTYIYIDDITITPVGGVIDNLNVQGDIRVLSGATARSVPRGLVKRAYSASNFTTSGTTELELFGIKGVNLTAGRDYEVKFHAETVAVSAADGIFLVKLYVDGTLVGQSKFGSASTSSRFPCDVTIPFSQATNKTNVYVYAACVRSGGTGTATVYGDNHLWLKDIGETALL